MAVEKLHPRFGPKEFRRHVQCPIREPEDEPRERGHPCNDIDVRPYADVAVADFRQQYQQADEGGERGKLWEVLREEGYKGDYWFGNENTKIVNSGWKW